MHARTCRLGRLAVGPLREHRSVRAGTGAELAVGQAAGLAERAGDAAEEDPVATTRRSAQPAVELPVGVDGGEARGRAVVRRADLEGAVDPAELRRRVVDAVDPQLDRP